MIGYVKRLHRNPQSRIPPHLGIQQQQKEQRHKEHHDPNTNRTFNSELLLLEA
jgi:hypothetical protein